MKEAGLPNYNLPKNKPISSKFLSLGCMNLYDAINFVHKLPYARTSKIQSSLVLNELQGTCSTKHGIIAELAHELNIEYIKLYAGILIMDSNIMPKIASVLKKYELSGVPEAHCYLEINQKAFDITFPENTQGIMRYKLVEKIQINPDQIGEFKINWHRNFIKKWIKKTNLAYTPEEIWTIREACITKLSDT